MFSPYVEQKASFWSNNNVPLTLPNIAEHCRTLPNIAEHGFILIIYVLFGLLCLIIVKDVCESRVRADMCY